MPILSHKERSQLNMVACKILDFYKDARFWTNCLKAFYTRSEKRWQCMDQSKLRQCGKAKCTVPCEDENRGKPKSHYGLPSVWRQKECLTCLIKVSYYEFPTS